MRLHIDALGYLQITWGAFGLLTGLSLGMLSVGTHVAAAAEVMQTGERTAVVVLAIGAGALLLGGGVTALTGWALHQRRRQARQVALVLAIPNLLFLPFGTALGVYTLWVLLNDDARRAFGRMPPQAWQGVSSHGS